MDTSRAHPLNTIEPNTDSPHNLKPPPLQKLPLPNFDGLVVPPFESELKRTAAHTKAAANKMAIPVAEAGTSVAPRQRPKASAQPSHNHLPLVAPPSPSPRNTVSSPSIPSAPPPAPANEASLPVVEPFATQFQANFPPVAPAPAPSHTQVQQAASVLERPVVEGSAPEPVNANLFPTTFEDPFVEAAPVVRTAVRTPSNPPSLSGSGSALFSAALAAESAATAAAFVPTPDEDAATDTLGAPKGVAGHRRNMSDTSAFNK